jgi:hypothetical protein
MYAIGDQVDGYVLTERGWVPRLDLDPSPHRPGHVVNGSILTGGLQWKPLRTNPLAPYAVGDVVEGYVLVPSGEWTPLANQTRDASGALVNRPAPRHEAPATPARTSRRTAAQRPATPRTAAPRTSAQHTASPQHATATHTTVAVPRTAAPATARPQGQLAPQPWQPTPGEYHVGQIVNGHILTADRGWVPLSGPMRRQQPQGTTRASALKGCLAPTIAGAVIVISMLSKCGN